MMTKHQKGKDMKKTKIVLLSIGMALCAAGGIGTALAAVTKNSSSSSGTSVYDKAVVLYWDSESQTKPARLTDIDGFVDGAPQYRHLIVSPKTSKSVSGTVSVNFTLSKVAVVGKTATVEGLTISVYELTSEGAITDENYVSLVGTGTLKTTLVGDDTEDATGSATFTVSTSSEVHETTKHYAIKVEYDDSGLGQNQKLSGQVTINQTFIA